MDCGCATSNILHTRARAHARTSIYIGTSKVRRLYTAGSLTAAARELARYKLDLVGAYEVGGKKGAQYEQGTIIFSMEREMKIISWEQDFLYTKG